MTITDEKIAEIRAGLRRKAQLALQLGLSTFRLDPPTATALLDRLDAAEAENARLREAHLASMRAAAVAMQLLGDPQSSAWRLFESVHRHAAQAISGDEGADEASTARAALEAKND